MTIPLPALDPKEIKGRTEQPRSREPNRSTPLLNPREWRGPLPPLRSAQRPRLAAAHDPAGRDRRELPHHRAARADRYCPRDRDAVFGQGQRCCTTKAAIIERGTT